MTINNQPLSNKEFSFLVGVLRDTCQKSWLRRIMQAKVKGSPWESFSVMWTSIIISIRHYTLSRLAAFFDPPSYEDKKAKDTKFNLSLYRILSKSDFNNGNQKTIDNLRILRNKTGSHFDSKYLMQWKVKEEDYGIDFKGEDIEALFDEIFELLNKVKKDYNYVGELNQKREKEYVEERFDAWYKVFIDSRTETT